jgi:hypothetical protein
MIRNVKQMIKINKNVPDHVSRINKNNVILNWFWGQQDGSTKLGTLKPFC